MSAHLAQLAAFLETRIWQGILITPWPGGWPVLENRHTGMATDRTG
jgi:hypothetical protein